MSAAAQEAQQALHRWEPHPKQLEYLTAAEDEVAFGGAAGGGKTEANIILGALRATQIPDTRHIFMRRTSRQLREAIDRSHRILGGRGSPVVWNAEQSRWKFPNGATLEFGMAENEADIYTYDSDQFATVIIDEAQRFTPRMLLYMLSRNRCVNPNARAYYRLTCNPGGDSHEWLKARYVDVADGVTCRVVMPDGSVRTRRFIRSTMDDNPTLLQNDPGYRARLLEMPEEDQARLLRGDWEISYEGRIFKEFRPDKHIVEEPDGGFPEDWPAVAGFDHGGPTPTAVVWARASILPNGRRRYWVCDEHYQSSWTVERHAQEILLRGLPRLWADPSTRKVMVKGQESVASLYREAGVHLVPANNEWGASVLKIRTMLAADPPELVIVHGRAPNLERELRSLRWRENAHGEAYEDSVGSDHAVDALRYATNGYVPRRSERRERRSIFDPLEWRRPSPYTVGGEPERVRERVI